MKRFHHSKKSVLILILFAIPSVLSYGFSLQTTSGHLDSSESKNAIQGFDGSPLNAGTNDGQQVIDYFRTVFESDWSRGLWYDQVEDDIGFPQSRLIYGGGYEPYPSQQLSDDMIITPILSPDNSEEKIIELINSANISLHIEQMYIYPDLVDILDAIVAANSRGVNCCVIVGDGNDASNESAFIFTQNGIDVKICDGTDPMFFNQHNKGVIVDSELVLISSINWSPTSLRDNREAGLIIQNTQVAGYYQMLFNHDWDVCDNYTSTESFKAIIPITAQNGNILESSTFSLDELPSASDYAHDFAEAPVFSGTMAVQLMTSPDNCFNDVATILESAQTSIDVSVYTLSSPYLLDILAAKLAEGVNIRLLLEQYQVGYYEKAYNRHSMYNLTVLGIPLLITPSINATASGKWADNAFTFQHSKYAIIDNQTLILSSGNWARSSCPKPQPDGDVKGNRDWWFAIYGKDPTDLPSDTQTDDPKPILSGYPVSQILGMGAFMVGVLAIFLSHQKKRNSF
jgi:phosphatidylserine/phosphatidylglycerophosphate/cardiolipin synthase-like enzyme